MFNQKTAYEMRQPAMCWEDACPVGNGEIGGLLYGHISQETVLLNHESHVRELPKPALDDFSHLLPRVRQALKEGDFDTALTLYETEMSQSENHGGLADPYLPHSLLWIDRGVNRPFTTYRRGLNMTDGEAWAKWDVQAQVEGRRMFACREQGVMFVNEFGSPNETMSLSLRFSPEDRFQQMFNQFCTKPNKISGVGDVGEAKQLPVEVRFGQEGSYFWMVGTVDTGVPYGVMARVLSPQAEVSLAAKVGLEVKVKGDCTIAIAMFTGEEHDAGLARVQKKLQDLNATQSYEDHLNPHAELHGALMDRCVLSFDSERSSRPSYLELGLSKTLCNEDLLAQAYDDEMSMALLQRMFTFGQYLLVSSSCVGGQPANLQGLWNGDYLPAWGCDIHNDINIQMNYWLALSTGMDEMMEPFLDYFMSHLEDYRENARKLYGCRGIVLPICQSTHGLVFDSKWVHWTGAAGWIAQHFYDAYLYSGDDVVLEEKVRPWLLECLAFYEDFIIEDERGQALFSPSISPENQPINEGINMVVTNASMDVSICREVCENLMSISLDRDGEGGVVERCRAILDKLPAYKVNADGCFSEWLDPRCDDNHHHRHLCQLYPVFPGFEITKQKHPELYEAERQVVKARQGVGLNTQTNWSMVFSALSYARFEDAAQAEASLKLLFKTCVGPNLFTRANDARGMGLAFSWLGQPPFQIEANMGFSSAVLEMICVSRPQETVLCSALPKTWSAGSLLGLRTRNRCRLDFCWSDGAVKVSCQVKSEVDQVLSLLSGDGYQFVESGGTAIERGIKAGESITIELARKA